MIFKKMCDCDEIQSQWTIKSARWCDIFHDPEDESINKCMNLIYVKDCFEEGIKLVWLPRQDQLQDMLPDWSKPLIISELHKFIEPEDFCVCRGEGDGWDCEVCHSVGRERRKAFESIEQITLGLVMHENFGKKWDGEGWV